MGWVILMARYKLARARELATIRYLRWLWLQRFRPKDLRQASVAPGAVVEYMQQGNVSRDLFLGQFERDVVNFVVHYLKPGMIVFDVGANIGTYSILSASLVGETGSVHAFEPTPESMARLRANVQLNGFWWVCANEVAVTEAVGRREFQLYQHAAMNSLAAQNRLGEPTRVCEVETTSLDDYVRIQGIPRVDLLKIDVEGAELSVLEGARGLLRSSNPPVILCEFFERTSESFGHGTSAVRELLEGEGYRLFRWNLKLRRLEPEPAGPGYNIYANLVCVKNSTSVEAMCPNTPKVSVEGVVGRAMPRRRFGESPTSS